MTPETPPPDHDALPPGTRLGEFEIQRVLGIGGFGIVYLAFDHALERHVALKEYMPSALAARGQGASVSIRSTSHVETFGVGLRSFVNEAKLLARFDHPSLVKVYRFWEDNGTAYMVMPYYQGRTLRDVRRGLHVPPDEGWLRGMLEPLLGALEVLHSEQVYHRDIAPDNILLLANGQPVLLDFGAARRVIGDRTQTLTAILKPNFAPIEQYAETAGLRQGPWTDLYALGAVVHYCLTGKPPTPAAARAVQDEMPSVRSLADALALDAHLHYGDAFVAAMDACLAVRPQGRPDCVAALRALLRGERPAEPTASQPVAAVPVDAFAPTQPYVPTEADAATRARTLAPTAAAARPAAAAPAEPRTAWAPAPAPDSAPVESSAPQPRPARRPGMMALIGLVPLVFAGLLWYVTSKPRGAGEALATPASAPIVAAATSAASNAGASTTVPAIAAATLAPVQAASAPVLVATAGASQPTHRPRPAHAETAVERHVAAVASAPTPAPPPRKADEAAAQAAQTPRPASPREACGRRVFFAMYLCMKRECDKAEFANHPQCQGLARQEEANQQRSD